MDPLAEKYYSISPYAYCAGNPMNRIDVNGDSISVTPDALNTIFYALEDGQNVHMNVNNGMIDPESIKDQANASDDVVLKDLYEIAKDDKVVEMSVATSYNYNDNDGNRHSSDETERKFDTPYDYDIADYLSSA